MSIVTSITDPSLASKGIAILGMFENVLSSNSTMAKSPSNLSLYISYWVPLLLLVCKKETQTDKKDKDKSSHQYDDR